MKNTLVRTLLKANARLTQKNAHPYPFIEWLKFANAGMLDNGNTYCFEYAIRHLPSDNPIIEIGSFCGLSTNLISFYKKTFNKKNKLITADRWVFEGGENPDYCLEGTNITNEEYKQFVKESYIRNISFFSKDDVPYTIEQFSDDFFGLWENNVLMDDILDRPVQLGGKIAFAYIDGNHTYNFARRDFLNTDKFLDKGGFILFDDSADYSDWEVSRVVKEVMRTGRYEVIVKNPNYLFRKIVD